MTSLKYFLFVLLILTLTTVSSTNTTVENYQRQLCQSNTAKNGEIITNCLCSSDNDTLILQDASIGYENEITYLENSTTHWRISDCSEVHLSGSTLLSLNNLHTLQLYNINELHIDNKFLAQYSAKLHDEMKAVHVGQTNATPILQLQSNHEEADTRVIVHLLYSFEALQMERVVIPSNETDVIVMCIYYTSKCNCITELWIRTETDIYLPIHETVDKLGALECAFLPFFHAMTGKDNTSFIYGTGEKKLWKAHKSLDCHVMADFADNSDSMPEISDKLLDSAAHLLHGYSGGNSCPSLAELQTTKFLSGPSGKLQSLPPTPDAFLWHENVQAF